MSRPILDADLLLQRAAEETGLDDYGDETLPHRFRVCVDTLRAADMPEHGQQAAAEICSALLTTRLHFFNDQKLYPLSEERIESPLFATGEPRSGTTLLHALLAVDPNARALRFWEVMHPSPPPGLAGPGDPRRALADAEWRSILKKIPSWLVNHPYNDMLGDGLPECERTWAFDFRMLTPTVWWRAPMKINMTGLKPDPRAQYRLHEMMLQRVQHGREKKQWVLKGFHSGRLAALFEAYPDAHMIWTHRDPVQVIASRIVMAGQLEEGVLGKVDWRQVAADYLALSRASIRTALESPLLDDPRITHVRYADFVADPVSTIRRFYEHANVQFTSKAEAAMRKYLQKNKGDRYGKFHYSLDVIGEDIESLHTEFAPYRERFGLEIEKRR